MRHRVNRGLRPDPKTPPVNDNYRDNYDRIFGKDKQPQKEGNKDG